MHVRTNFDIAGNGGGDDMGGGVGGMSSSDGSPLVYISGENDRMA